MRIKHLMPWITKSDIPSSAYDGRLPPKESLMLDSLTIDPGIKMAGGMVVPIYDPALKYCGYCNTKMVWREKSHGYSPYSGKEYGTYKTFGCPRYGDNGWHYFWWEDNLFDLIKKDMQESGELDESGLSKQSD